MNSPTPMPIRACAGGGGEKEGRRARRSRTLRARSPRSRGPSRFDPPTPARIRHTRTPMLRGRVQMLRWGPRPIHFFFFFFFLVFLDFLASLARLFLPARSFLPPLPLVFLLLSSFFYSLGILRYSSSRVLVLPLCTWFVVSFYSFFFFFLFWWWWWWWWFYRGRRICTPAELIAGRRGKIAVM